MEDDCWLFNCTCWSISAGKERRKSHVVGSIMCVMLWKCSPRQLCFCTGNLCEDCAKILCARLLVAESVSSPFLEGINTEAQEYVPECSVALWCKSYSAKMYSPSKVIAIVVLAGIVMLPFPTCGKYLIENHLLYDDKTIIVQWNSL